MSEYSEYNPNLETVSEIQIPENEFIITFSCSSGKGGQNVNRRATKATLRWNLWQSSLAHDVKLKVYEKLSNKFTENGDLIISDQTQRSQLHNKNNVITKLNEMINIALEPEIERIETQPSKSSQEKRIYKKVKCGRKKDLRKKITEW